MSKTQKQVILLLIGIVFVFIYLGVVSLIIGESIFNYYDDNFSFFLTIVGSGGIIGKYLGNKLLDD